jgi:hypothetical protein
LTAATKIGTGAEVRSGVSEIRSRTNIGPSTAEIAPVTAAHRMPASSTRRATAATPSKPSCVNLQIAGQHHHDRKDCDQKPLKERSIVH